MKLAKGLLYTLNCPKINKAVHIGFMPFKVLLYSKIIDYQMIYY